jgi:hypothetical protein
MREMEERDVNREGIAEVGDSTRVSQSNTDRSRRARRSRTQRTRWGSPDAKVARGAALTDECP